MESFKGAPTILSTSALVVAIGAGAYSYKSLQNQNQRVDKLEESVDNMLTEMTKLTNDVSPARIDNLFKLCKQLSSKVKVTLTDMNDLRVTIENQQEVITKLVEILKKDGIIDEDKIPKTRRRVERKQVDEDPEEVEEEEEPVQRRTRAPARRPKPNDLIDELGL